MKKITFLAAAVAMLAFASCNKEEGQVALKFGGERYTSDKQAYEDNYVRFTNGEDIFVNGIAYHLNAKSDGRTATVWCPAQEEYNVVYGDVTIDEATGDILTTFKNRVMGISEGYTTLGANHNPWPLTAYVTDADENFTLRHAVAIVSGGIKLGGSFFPYISAKLGESATDVPTITFDSMMLTSYTDKICGDATLNTDGSIPYFEMDEELDDPETLTVLVPGSRQVAVSDPAGYGSRYFNTTIVPCEVPGSMFEVTFCFTANYENGHQHHFTYRASLMTGQTVGNTTTTLLFNRGQRVDLKANLYDQNTGNWNTKIAVID